MLSWSRHAFSLVIAMGLSLIFWIIWLFLMEYIVPFSRSTVNIENASIAQYQSLSWIEQSLYSISQEAIWFSSWATLVQENNRQVSYNIIGSGSTIPRPWTGNGLDSNWNRLSQTEPIQLLVGNNRISNFELRLRIPDFWGTWTLWPSWIPLVLWQISSESQTLSASGWIIRTNDIPFGANIWNREGILISNNATQTFWNFYASHCNNVSSECVLRISLINKILQWSTELPYLEYQIESNNPIPYQITNIETTGISYGFSRKYNVRVPQATTSAAFDFTVFQ